MGQNVRGDPWVRLGRQGHAHQGNPREARRKHWDHLRVSVNRSKNVLDITLRTVQRRQLPLMEAEHVAVAKRGCKRMEMYSQRDQVGHEDPHSLSGHGRPAEENENKASEQQRIYFVGREALFPSPPRTLCHQTGPVWGRTKTHRRPPKWRADATGGPGYLLKTAPKTCFQRHRVARVLWHRRSRADGIQILEK